MSVPHKPKKKRQQNLPQPKAKPILVLSFRNKKLSFRGWTTEPRSVCVQRTPFLGPGVIRFCYTAPRFSPRMTSFLSFPFLNSQPPPRNPSDNKLSGIPTHPTGRTEKTPTIFSFFIIAGDCKK